MMRVLIYFFITSISFAQHQEIDPDFYLEISERAYPRDYYNLKFGIPSEIIVNDTIFLRNSEKMIERNVYSYTSKNIMEVKKYEEGELVADEKIELDSLKRILNYKGNLKYDGDKWYYTTVKYEYKENLKIKEKINGFGETYLRYIVKYDSLKNPTIIESIIVASGSTRFQTISYDYLNGKFLLMDLNYQGKREEEVQGDIVTNYIIETNDFGDITKMYWMLTNKDEPYIHKIDYKYDEKGNWIKMVRNVLSPDGSIIPYHRTSRTISYKN